MYLHVCCIALPHIYSTPLLFHPLSCNLPSIPLSLLQPFLHPPTPFHPLSSNSPSVPSSTYSLLTLSLPLSPTLPLSHVHSSNPPLSPYLPLSHLFQPPPPPFLASPIKDGKQDLKRYWMPDSACRECSECGTKFNLIVRRHHCRICGRIFCNACCSLTIPAMKLRPDLQVLGIVHDCLHACIYMYMRFF